MSNLVKEGCEGSGRPTGWTLATIDESAGSSDWDYATSPAPLSGSHSAYMTTDGQRFEYYVYGNVDPCYAYWICNIDTVNAHNHTVVHFDDEDINGLLIIRRSNAGYARITDLNNSTDHDSTYSMSEGSTYYFWLEYNASGNVKLWINTTSTKPANPEITFTSSSSSSLGMIALSVEYTGVNIFDNIVVSTTQLGNDPYNSAILEQEGFRFRNDDGSESAATWKASQDVNINLAANTATRLRMLLDSSDDVDSSQYQLEYRYKASGGSYGSWRKAESSPAEYETPAYVNSTTGSGSGSASTLAATSFSVTTGNTIIVGISNYTTTQRTVSSISDTAGNTYARCGSVYQPSSNFTQETWVAYNITGNASNVITATYSGAATYRGMVAHQVSGLATSSAYDKQATNFATSTSATVGPTSTTAQTYEYLFAFFMVFDTGTGTAGANYTERVDAGQIYSEDRVVTSTSTYSATATLSGGGSGYGAMLSTFKAKASSNEITLSLSANIAASAATSTTAQLTAPSGKTTTDFQAGKISDDTNPLPAIDLSEDKYTELEWCVITDDGLSSNAEIEFRVTVLGVTLNTYTVTPKITIGTATIKINNTNQFSKVINISKTSISKVIGKSL